MEFNKEIKESVSSAEQTVANELYVAPENISEKESILSKETGVGEDVYVSAKPQEEEEKLSKEFEEKMQESNQSSQSGDGGASASGGSAVSAGGTAAIGAAAGAAAVVVAVAVAVSSVTGAAINDISLTGTSLQYNVGIEIEYTVPEEQEFADVDFSDFDTGLRLVVYNNNFEEVVELSLGNENCEGTFIPSEPDRDGEYTLSFTFTGEVSGLSPNTRYKVELLGDKSGGGVTTYDSRQVKTVGYETAFKGIEYQCRCDTVDHDFLFTLKYVDENNYYSDFSYILAPSANNSIGTQASGTITDPSVTQSVKGADNMSGKYYDLIITFTSTADTDLEKVGTTETINGIFVEYSAGLTEGGVIITMTIQVEI